MEVNGSDHRRTKRQELRVGVRALAWLEQIAKPASDRPVDVFARAVDAGKWLFVEQACHPVFLRNPCQRLHDCLLVVGGNIGIFIEGGNFILPRSHLVVSRFHRHAEFVELPFAIQHAGQNTLWDRPEILIFKLLPLWGLRAKQRATCHHEIGPGKVEIAVDQKIFLLGAGRSRHLTDVLVSKQGQHAVSLLVNRLHRTQKWRFLIEGLSGPRAKRGRNAERCAIGIVEDIGGAGRIPRGVTSGLKRGAQPAGWKARCIGLALNQFLAGKLCDGIAVACGREKTIVLLCGEPREGIENVCVVRGTLFNGPVLHRHRHGVCNAGIDLLALLDRCLQCPVDALGQTVFHDRVAENIGAKNLARGSLAKVPSLTVRLVVVNRRNRTGTGTCHGTFFLLWGAWRRRGKRPAGKRKLPGAVRLQNGGNCLSRPLDPLGPKTLSPKFYATQPEEDFLRRTQAFRNHSKVPIYRRAKPSSSRPPATGLRGGS